MKFFFDNSVSSNLTAALRLLKPDHDIAHLTDRFPSDVLDEVWLRAAARDRDLVLISADPTITSSKKQQEIWRMTGLTSFFFGSGFADQLIAARTEEVVRWWPAIVAEAKQAKRGTGYLLPFQARKPSRLYEPFKTRARLHEDPISPRFLLFLRVKQPEAANERGPRVVAVPQTGWISL